MKSKQVVFELSNGGNVSKYDVFFNSIQTNDTRLILTQSQFDNGWHEPGKVEAVLEDNGDYMIITFEGKKAIKLDYSQAAMLRCLLHAEDMANAKKHPGVYPTKLQKFDPHGGL